MADIAGMHTKAQEILELEAVYSNLRAMRADSADIQTAWDELVAAQEEYDEMVNERSPGYQYPTEEDEANPPAPPPPEEEPAP